MSTEIEPVGISQENLNEMAKNALERSDAQELYHHYETALRKADNISKALETIAAHYITKTDSPRFFPTQDAISAMERVSLAAIDLAKAVASNGDGK